VVGKSELVLRLYLPLLPFLFSSSNSPQAQLVLQSRGSVVLKEAMDTVLEVQDSLVPLLLKVLVASMAELLISNNLLSSQPQSLLQPSLQRPLNLKRRKNPRKRFQWLNQTEQVPLLQQMI